MNRPGGSNQRVQDNVQSPPGWIHGPSQKEKKKSHLATPAANGAAARFHDDAHGKGMYGVGA